MKTIYQELRHIQKSPGSLASDLTKHLQRRQHLGTAVVICEQPFSLMPVVRKQWFKITRNLQRERAATVNAQKILQLTYAVTRMHHLTFVSKAPSKHPNADVFFVTPSELTSLPERCFSLYVIAPIEPSHLQTLISQLLDQATVFDYEHITSKLSLKFRPKAELADRVRNNWAEVKAFLQEQQIDIEALAQHSAQQPALLDDALDVLLDHGQDFLGLAGSFHHNLQLAQPLDLTHETQKRYSTLALLAHRVQTLSAGNLAEYLDSIGSDSAFFLRDSASEQDERQQLVELLTYHQQAGHGNIYKLLKQQVSDQSSVSVQPA